VSGTSVREHVHSNVIYCTVAPAFEASLSAQPGSELSSGLALRIAPWRERDRPCTGAPRLDARPAKPTGEV